MAAQSISAVFQDYNHYSLTLAENIWLGDLHLPATQENGRLQLVIARTPVFDGPLDASRRRRSRHARQRGPHRVPPSQVVWTPCWAATSTAAKNSPSASGKKSPSPAPFLRPSQLLILDEPSSALDPRAEAELFDSFRELVQGRAALLISHRLSTVRLADTICVIDKGTIVARGTHDELIAQGGLYAQLFETQAQSYR